MGEIKIARKVIGSFTNMEQVLKNWNKLDAGCVTASRRDYIELMIRMKKHIWDHNIALVWLLKKLKVESYLEVGVLTCGSTVHAFCSKKCKRVVGIDAFNSTYADKRYIKNKNVLEDVVMKQASMFNKSIQFHKGISQVELPKIKESFDLALVDGDHSEAGAMKDLELTLPKVRKAIVFDDIHHPSHVYLEDVAYDFARKHKLDYTINHQPPGTVIFWVEKNPT
jgi:predicted O-methyltransferase YrrM